MTTTSASVPDKWIAGIADEATVREAAPIVLRRRLEAVADLVKKVRRHAAQDAHAVHQLRVGTRRAQAALLSFKPWLRRACKRRIRRILSALRDVAGAVRMADVHQRLIARDLGLHQGAERMALEFALMTIAREREADIALLVKAAKRTSAKVLRKAADRLVRDELGGSGAARAPDADDPRSTPTTDAAHARRSIEAPMREAGHAAIAAVACDLLAAAEADLACRENLHDLRIRGKRLRYAMEIFGALEADSPRLVTAAEELTRVQDRLGEVNDCFEVAERLRRYATEADRVSDTIAAQRSALGDCLQQLGDEYDNRGQRQMHDFLTWWRDRDGVAFRDRIALLANGSGGAAPGCRGRAETEPKMPEITILATSNGPAVFDEPSAVHVAAPDDGADAERDSAADHGGEPGEFGADDRGSEHGGGDARS